MHEDLNQKISQLLDDELDHQEALSLLKKIQSTPDLNNKLNRYEAISQTLKTDIFLLPDRDFSARISSLIEQEPIYFLPQRRNIINHSRKLVATAASIAVIGMIAGLNMNQPVEDVKMASALQSSSTVSVNPGVASRKKESDPVNKQINDYLQAHNSSVYTNGQANFQPYARVTTYSQK